MGPFSKFNVIIQRYRRGFFSSMIQLPLTMDRSAWGNKKGPPEKALEKGYSPSFSCLANMQPKTVAIMPTAKIIHHAVLI